jgi:transcriptional regulator with XRE-family HTH domain
MQGRSSISERLRKAIVQSDIPYRQIEQATGVKRASISRFVRGKRTLRLDVADRLAGYLGLELKEARRR